MKYVDITAIIQVIGSIYQNSSLLDKLCKTFDDIVNLQVDIKVKLNIVLYKKKDNFKSYLKNHLYFLRMVEYQFHYLNHYLSYKKNFLVDLQIIQFLLFHHQIQ